MTTLLDPILKEVGTTALDPTVNKLEQVLAKTEKRLLKQLMYVAYGIGSSLVLNVLLIGYIILR